MSKFSAPKYLEKQEWTGVKPNKVSTDGQLLKASTNYIALNWDAGNSGALQILDINHNGIGAISSDCPLIRGHTDQILDFDFLPFNDKYISTCSLDQTIQTWKIPEDLSQLSETHTSSILYGHKKKVHLIEYNPSSEGVLASASYDSTIKIWDVMNGQMKYSVQSTENAYSMNWNLNGSILGSIWRDKKMRLTDPRTEKFTTEVKAHEGGKAQKICFMGSNLDNIVSIGFSKDQKREFKVWDMKKMDEPLKTEEIDSATGVFMPNFDKELNLLWLVGKGDLFLRYYEWKDGAFQNYHNKFTAKTQTTGCCFVPKTKMNKTLIEYDKCYYLADKQINSISVQTSIQKKTDDLYDAYYPLCPYDLGQDSASYFLNQNAECKQVKMKLDEEIPVASAYKEHSFIQMPMPEYMQGSAQQKEKGIEVAKIDPEELERQKNKYEKLRQQFIENQNELEVLQNSNTERQNVIQNLQQEIEANKQLEQKQQEQKQEEEQQNNDNQEEHLKRLQQSIEKQKQDIDDLFQCCDVIGQTLESRNFQQINEHHIELEGLLKTQCDVIQEIKDEIMAIKQ